jgi:hypothetical protein
VRGGVVYTPSTTTILEGITRLSLITLAGDLGLQVVEQPISRDQLYIADEVFVCGTAADCIGLREIDYRVIGSGKSGPVTKEIQRAFHAAARPPPSLAMARAREYRHTRLPARRRDGLERRCALHFKAKPGLTPKRRPLSTLAAQYNRCLVNLSSRFSNLSPRKLTTAA